MLSFSHFILNSFKMKNQKGDDNHAHGSKDNDAKDDSHSHGENGNDGNAIPRPVANNPYAKKQQKKENEAHKMGQLSRHQVKATRRVRVRRRYQLRSNLLSDTASLLPLPKNCRQCVLLDNHHKAIERGEASGAPKKAHNPQCEKSVIFKRNLQEAKKAAKASAKDIIKEAKISAELFAPSAGQLVIGKLPPPVQAMNAFFQGGGPKKAKAITLERDLHHDRLRQEALKEGKNPAEASRAAAKRLVEEHLSKSQAEADAAESPSDNSKVSLGKGRVKPQELQQVLYQVMGSLKARAKGNKVVPAPVEAMFSIIMDMLPKRYKAGSNELMGGEANSEATR